MEGWRPGRPCSGSLPGTSARGTVVNERTITPSSEPQEIKQGLGRHGEFRKAPIGATNNRKAEKGKNNDRHDSKNLSITKNDGQISSILQSKFQYQKILAHQGRKAGPEVRED